MKNNKNRILLLLGIMLGVSGCVSSSGVDENAADIEASRYNTQAAAEYYRQGSIETALEKAEKAIDQDDENADAWMIYGMILASRGNPEDIDNAEDAYEEAVSLRPEDPSIRNNYGSFLCGQGEYRDAIEEFISVAKDRRYHKPEAAWTNAGTCAMRIPDYINAEEYLRSALEINREYAPALWQMAQLMLERDKALPARAFLQRLEAMGQLPAEALWLGVQIEKNLNDQAAAQRYADILLRDYPESREAVMVLEMREAEGND
ncbi:MAG: type IV pilus biogenesis/stability protein PilW [Gammaproteobacteria bacterium]|nr:type IV pilus biogenesis/stability protein PilW [Gammaproteobacteria bacterium]